MADAALQRKNMVESQVRPSDMTDRRIMGAMMALPRERFVPEGLAALAYMDEALAVAPGRGLMAPRDFARLIQLAEIEAGERVLDIGALSGYSSAVLARLGHDVVALESDAAAHDSMVSILKSLDISNVCPVSGPLTAGWPAAAPYDVIVLEGAVEMVPDALLAQLSANGRIAGIAREGKVSRAFLLKKTPEGGARRAAFEASAPALPGFEVAKGFAF